jgi:outer membrane protein OmpA-like peptidoglycan-associated protein/protocatechuate 3,4-dioxygenase beta subunit
MSIKLLLIIGFIFTAGILSAQESNTQSEFYSVMMTGDAEFIIKNLNVNSENQDFGTVYYKDKIVFASSRPSSKFIRRVWNLNNLPFLDLFVADVHNSELLKVKPFDKNINNKYHEGPASFNEAGTFMAFTRNNYEGKSTDAIVKLKLYTAQFENGIWSDAQPIRFNSNEYSVGHPSLTADGNTMYFASDMPGGIGGVDIYVTSKNDKGEWSDPKNLGSSVNTSGNEMFPFIYQNDCLFFASTGHEGLGGLDLFFSKKVGDQFSEPKNIGSPINSNKDDFSFIIDNPAEKGYFSSNRDGGKGDDDIYSFILVKPAKKEIAFKGKVLDNTGNNLTDTYIVVFDGKGNQINVFEGDKNGEFNINIRPEVFYKLEVRKENFQTGELEIFSNGSDSLLTQNLVLERIYNYTFKFNVTDQHTKERIENAKISYTDKLRAILGETFTDDKGMAVISLADYKLSDQIEFAFELNKDGYVEKSTEYKTILQQEENFDIDIEMLNVEMQSDTISVVVAPPVDVLLKGKVIDNSGNPLADVGLVLFDGNGNQFKVLKSNTTGEFSVLVDRDKNYKLEGVKEKYATGSIIIDTHTLENEINKNLTLNLIPEFNIICHVTDIQTKESISGVKGNYVNMSKGTGGELLTDVDGKCVIKIENHALKDVLSYTFSFQKEGYIEKTAKFNTVLVNEGNYTFEVEMQTTDVVTDTAPIVADPPVDVLLKGKVLDNEGHTIAFATITIDNGKGVRNEIKSDAKGEFSQTLLRNSYYKIEWFKEKYQNTYTIISTKIPDNEIVKDLILQPIPEFYLLYSIIDVDTKEPIANVNVHYESQKSGVMGNSVSDLKGTGKIKTEGFQLNEITDYTLNFQKEGYEEKTVKYEKLLDKAGIYDVNVELKKTAIVPDTTVITVVPPSELQIVGKVRDNENQILTDAKVTLYDQTGRLVKTVLSDQTGAFSFTIKPGNNGKLEAMKDKYSPAVTLFESKSTDTLIVLELVCEVVAEPLYNIEFICYVKDTATKSPVTNTKVTVLNKAVGEDQVLRTNQEGKIAVQLKNIKLNDQIDYVLTFENEAYSKKTINYGTTIKKPENLILNVELLKFEIGENLAELPEMKPIYFDYDKYSIREDAATELNKIVKLMNDYPHLEIALSSYTDCRGSGSYNLDLSNKRVKATADYIKKRISNPTRITGKGFGENNPVNDCNCEENTSEDCTEDQYQQNRRTEFKVIKK